MKHTQSIAPTPLTARRKLYLAIATQMLLAAGAQAAPTGGVVVAGEGLIDQSGLETTITQNTERLAIDWASFNVRADERVQFIQPGETSVALNRILGNEASQIFGRLDANGHVILMNPNGVLFGESATVNVGGLVASGLAINPDDFMNGDFALSAVEGLDGAVINQGIINAATGGSVALVGKRVANEGLISAKLGSVTLAAGKEAVLTFDNEGLLGVRVSQEILQSELGVEAAVSNSGEIHAERGRILLTGSVSQDIFSRAVNSGGLNAKTSVVMHEDGSFTLGAGADVVNTGTLDTSSNMSTLGDAGQIVVLGENIENSGAILADNHSGIHAAGNIEIHSRDTTLITGNSQIRSANDGLGSGGQIKILGDRVGVLDQSQIDTSGTLGGGDINIGGGFQGKETQLRNATRTVVGKNVAIEANAIAQGDGGDVIVWADEATSFTGEIQVRGGLLGGDGGFVEVSGKENLRFSGKVDRTAANGKNGTLLLDPKGITIVRAATGDNDDELVDAQILFNDGLDQEFRISDAAISEALASGDVKLQALEYINTEITPEILSIIAPDEESLSSLILESGGYIILDNLEIDLGSGDLVLVAGVEDLASDKSISIDNSHLATNGSMHFYAGGGATILSGIGENAAGEQIRSVQDINIYGMGGVLLVQRSDITILGDLNISGGSELSSISIFLPSSSSYVVPKLTLDERSSSFTASFIGAGGPGGRAVTTWGNINISAIRGHDQLVGGGASLYGVDIISERNNSISISSDGGISVWASNFSSANQSSTDIILDAAEDISVDSMSDINTLGLTTNGGNFIARAKSFEFRNEVYINTAADPGLSEGDQAVGNVRLESVDDLMLPSITSSGDLVVESTSGRIYSSATLQVEGNTEFNAAGEIRLGEGFSLISSTGDVVMNAGLNLGLYQFFLGQPVISTGGNISLSSTDGFIALTGIYNARDLEISSLQGSFSGEQVEINAEGNVGIHLQNGAVDFTGGNMTVNAGSFSVTARELQLGGVTINTDTSKGSGDITLIATGSDSEFDIWMPTINPDGIFTTGDLFVSALAEGGSVRIGDTGSGIPQRYGFINLSGSARFDVAGDLHLPEINTSNVQGDRDIVLNVGGTVHQNHDLFTGGANYIATASEFVFGDGVQINTDYLNETQDALTGSGNVVIETSSDQSDLYLPNIVTQVNCVDVGSCGTLKVSGANNVSAEGNIRISGDAIFDVSGDLQIVGNDRAPLGKDNRLSSVRILNAQKVDIFNNGDLTLDGVNAESLSLNILGNIDQTGSLNIAGETSIVAAPDTNIDLSNPLNDFNVLSVQSTGASVINITDSGAITLSNLNLDGTGQGGVLSVTAASIAQAENSSILLQDSAQLNLTGDFITLGANGTATVDINGAVLNGVFASDFNVQGAIRGAAGVVDTQLAGFYVNGSAADNFVEIAVGASITGDFREGSSIAMGDGNDIANIAGDVAISMEGGAGQDTFTLAPDISIAQILGGEGLDTLVGADVESEWIIGVSPDTDFNQVTMQDKVVLFAGVESLIGGSAADTFIVNGTANNLQTNGVLSVNGGDGDDMLNTRASSAWDVGMTGGSVTSVVNEPLAFDSFEFLRSDAATFKLRDLNVPIKSFISDSGTGVLDLSSISETVVFDLEAPDFELNGIISIVGNGADSTVSSSRSNGTWILTSYDVSSPEDAVNGWTDFSGRWYAGLGAYDRYSNNESPDYYFFNFGRVQGGSGNDEFHIAQLFYPISAMIDGGLGENSVHVQLPDAAGYAWTIDAVNQGTFNGSTRFENIQHLFGSAGGDTFTFSPDSSIGSITGGAGDDTFILANNVTAGILDGGAGNDLLDRGALNVVVNYLRQFVDGDAIYVSENIETETSNGGSTTVTGVDGYTARWFITGDGSLRVVVTDAEGVEVTNEFTGVTRAQGGEGFDAFILQKGGTLAEGIFGSGNDYLQGSEATNTWTIDGLNSGEVAAQESGTRLRFQGISHLYGGNLSDTFDIAAGGSITGSIYGSGGADTLMISNASVTNDWQLGESNSHGLVSFFTEIETLIGNANNDVFHFNSATDVVAIQGGAGENRVLWTAGDLTMNLASSQLNDVRFTDIQSVTADAAAYNTLIGADTANTWTLTDAHSGSVNGLSFSEFQELRGGAQEDTLVGADVESEWIIGVDPDTNINQIAMQDRITLFAGMESLIGGSAADTFIFNGILSSGGISSDLQTNGVSRVSGGDGDDMLKTRVSASWDVGMAGGSVTSLADAPSTLIFDSFELLRSDHGSFKLQDLNVPIKSFISDSGTGVLDLSSISEAVVFDLENPGFELYGIISVIGNGAASTVRSSSANGGWILGSYAVNSPEEVINGWTDFSGKWYAGSGGLDRHTNSEAPDYYFMNFGRVQGGSGDDEFHILPLSYPISAVIDGGLGNNSIYAQSLNSDGYAWTIDAVNQGTFNGSASFENIQHLFGSAGGDTFTFSPDSGIGSITGGAGDDTFIIGAGVTLGEIYGGDGNDHFVIGRDVTANNMYGEAGDDSFEVDLGLKGVLDGGSGDEVTGDSLDLSRYTVLTPSADLESQVGFTFRNFENITRPNTHGVYTGSNGTNYWYITGQNEGRLEIRDGADAGVYEFSGVHSLQGGTGEDIFIFANDEAAITTIIDGGDGINTLDLSAQDLINQWLIDGANSGRVVNDSNSEGNLFTNIAYLIGGSGRDTFTLAAGGSISGGIDGGQGDDQLAVATVQANTWLLGGAGGHSVNGVASFRNIEGLQGGAGDDSFEVLSENLDITRVDGGAGNDSLHFRYDAPVLVNLAEGTAGGLLFSAIERLISAVGGGTLIAADTSNNWTLDGADSGSIRYLINTDDEAINVAFDGFGNLKGGSADDQFTFVSGASLSGVLDGGEGNDRVDLQAVAGEVHVASQAGVILPQGVPGLNMAAVETLVGNGRTWLHGASDQSYTWTISGARSGQLTSTLVDASNQLLAFENLSAIVGGAHDDIFRIMVASPLLSLDGGSAVTVDLVDYSQVNGNLSLYLAEALSDQSGEVTGVEAVRGNNSGPDSIYTAELVAANGNNLWIIGAGSSDLVDGINDGQVISGDQVIQFLDFNVLIGGSGTDTFEFGDGVLSGTLQGGAGDDVFDVRLLGVDAVTRIDGGEGNDILILSGGDSAGLMTFTAALNGGEIDYSLGDNRLRLTHQAVESIRDQSLVESLEVRGSSQADIISLANGSFRVNTGPVVEYANKAHLAVRAGINDLIQINDHLVVAESVTLANGTVIANDPANSSITTGHLILEATRDVGLASARLRTSLDALSVRDSVGDIYLQEQNGLDLQQFNANGVFDLVLLNGNLTNSSPLVAQDVFRVNAVNGNITLTGANQLRDDVALSGRRVELHNASTLTLVGVTAEDLILRTQRGIEGDGPLVVSGLTEIDAQGDVILDYASNDFNRVRVTNAWNLTLVDQNTLELLGINASGAVVVRGANNISLDGGITAGAGVDVRSSTGNINQNGSITSGNGAVVVEASEGAVNMGDDARVLANGGSVTITAGSGDVNMGADTRIAANGGNVNIEAAESVVVAEVVSSGSVVITAGNGNVTDGNGGATNIVAGDLQSSSKTGFGSDDALETRVAGVSITTETGDVGLSNTGDVTVGTIRTQDGNVNIANQGNVDLAAGSIAATKGSGGGDVTLDVTLGSVKQTGSSDAPAIIGGDVSISAPQGAVGEGGLRVDADRVRVVALAKAGEIFVNPGADKIEYFSGSFKFEDQLLSVEPLDDIDPAIFTNVRSYFYNDISLLLPSDQRYDEEAEEE